MRVPGTLPQLPPIYISSGVCKGGCSVSASIKRGADSFSVGIELPFDMWDKRVKGWQQRLSDACRDWYFGLHG